MVDLNVQQNPKRLAGKGAAPRGKPRDVTAALLILTRSPGLMVSKSSLGRNRLYWAADGKKEKKTRGLLKGSGNHVSRQEGAAQGSWFAFSGRRINKPGKEGLDS